ncbi:hypothetical protein ACFFKU_12920 [Kineococcus gynurae]|uniref:hypothetical protein n=1 Tax=Kineococcus gynurae TaxID=452979 RepID=UPI0035E590DB
MLEAVRTARPRVVGVDGRSGAGKTGFAARLGAALAAPVLAVEDLYRGWDGLAGAVEELSPLLRRWRAGVPARFRRWDWAAGCDGAEVTVAPAPLLVVEGVGCSAADGVDLLVWLELDAPTRKARALARDGDTFAPFWDRWAAQEDALFSAHPVERGGVVVQDGRAVLVRDIGQQLQVGRPEGSPGPG